MEDEPPDPTQPPAVIRRAGWGILAIGLVLGVLAGVGGTVYWTTDFWKKKPTAKEPPPAVVAVVPVDPIQEMLDRWGARVVKDLALSPVQERAVNEELGFTRVAAHDLKADFGRQSGRLAADLVERIARRLPPETEQRLRLKMKDGLAAPELWRLLTPEGGGVRPRSAGTSGTPAPPLTPPAPPAK